MEIVFWLSIFLTAYAYGGYLILIVILSVFGKKEPRKGENEVSVSLIISAYNEEKDIEKKLRNTLELDYPKDKMEIIVASDASTDGTDEIVRRYAGKSKEIPIILHRVEGRLGKTAAQNSAVRICRGDIIIFSDAASMYDRGAIRAIVKNYADPEVGAVSGMYKYINRKGASVGFATILFWNLENFIKSRQTMIKTITGCCGCIYSVRKELYTELPPNIISDLVEPLTILKKGYRIAFEPKALAYEETTEKPKQEFNMRIRVIIRGMNGILFMKGLLNPLKYPFIAFQLFSHKVMRWMVPIFCIAAFLSNIFLAFESSFYLILLLGQTLFYLMALIGFYLEKINKKLMIFYLPMYFLIVNTASLVSIFKVLKGENVTVWQTER